MHPLILLCILSLAAPGDDLPAAKPADKAPAAADPKPAADAGASAETARRVELNLLGKTDTAVGESRRNENVQFNLIDNNALKDLNVRMGTTATIVNEFRVDRNYFGVEFGNRPPAPLHVPPAKLSARHGTLYESHSNSVLAAR